MRECSSTGYIGLTLFEVGGCHGTLSQLKLTLAVFWYPERVCKFWTI